MANVSTLPKQNFHVFLCNKTGAVVPPVALMNSAGFIVRNDGTRVPGINPVLVRVINKVAAKHDKCTFVFIQHGGWMLPDAGKAAGALFFMEAKGVATGMITLGSPQVAQQDRAKAIRGMLPGCTIEMEQKGYLHVTFAADQTDAQLDAFLTYCNQIASARGPNGYKGGEALRLSSVKVDTPAPVAEAKETTKAKVAPSKSAAA